MKKIILASLFMAGLAVSVNAQKGSVLLYGNVSYTNSENASGIETSAYSFKPGIGYQFSNNWTIGIAGGVNGSKTEAPATSSKVNGFNVGPFLRYTKTLSNTFFVFGQLNADYVSSTSKSTFGGESKTTGFNAAIVPAVGINVYKGFALNFSFGSLSYQTTKQEGSAGSNKSFGLNFGNQALFGVSKNF